MFNELISQSVRALAQYGTDFQMPFMVLTFMGGLGFRAVIFFTVRCEYVFSLEFEKRVHKHLADPEKHLAPNSFHQLAKKLLERTFHEHFELKAKYKRRRFDHVTTVTDRLFLIQAGSNRLVKDTLSQTRYLRKGQGREPKFLDLSKFVFSSNPVFNKVFAVFSMGVFNDVLNLLPGLFVIGGIFGTFLGTMQALPALSQIDISNADATKHIMDTFLLKMAHCMTSSIVGIALSVGMTVINAVLSPEGMYVDMIHKYTSALEFLWNDTDTNELNENREEATQAIDRRTTTGRRAKTWTPKTNKGKKVNEAPVLQAPNGAPLEAQASDAVAEAPSPEAAESAVATGPNPAAGDGGGSPAMAALETSSNVIEVLRLRLNMIDAYREKALSDMNGGTLSEALWKEENARWLEERRKVEQEIEMLTKGRKDAA